MKELELSELYYQEYGLPLIRDNFSDYYHEIAAGLVGEGSGCFGFDDEISRDHDWGLGFCIWLPPSTYKAIGTELNKAINNIPKTFMGYERKTSEYGGGRIGVFEITQFYSRFIGLNHVPETIVEWGRIPESYLAVATNGKIFMDNLGLFTAFRNDLLDFYPDEIRLRKIAARCMTMAKTGQYNYQRSMRRNEEVAAHHALMKFIEATISMVFLLNKKYTPFYKWMHKSMKNLEILGSELYDNIAEICRYKNPVGWKRNIEIIEHISRCIIQELHNQNLSNSKSDFLLDHGNEVLNFKV